MCISIRSFVKNTTTSHTSHHSFHLSALIFFFQSPRTSLLFLPKSTGKTFPASAAVCLWNHWAFRWHPILSSVSPSSPRAAVGISPRHLDCLSSSSACASSSIHTMATTTTFEPRKATSYLVSFFLSFLSPCVIRSSRLLSRSTQRPSALQEIPLIWAPVSHRHLVLVFSSLLVKYSGSSTGGGVNKGSWHHDEVC